MLIFQEAITSIYCRGDVKERLLLNSIGPACERGMLKLCNFFCLSHCCKGSSFWTLLSNVKFLNSSLLPHRRQKYIFYVGEMSILPSYFLLFWLDIPHRLHKIRSLTLFVILLFQNQGTIYETRIYTEHCACAWRRMQTSSQKRALENSQIRVNKVHMSLSPLIVATSVHHPSIDSRRMIKR